MKITYLIGNGFDRALDGALTRTKGKSLVGTSYTKVYGFLDYFDFNKNELKDNVFVNDLKKTSKKFFGQYLFSDWEKLMVNRFNKHYSPSKFNKLFKEKDQAVGYIKEVFRLWENGFDNSVIDSIYPEFEESIINLFSRISPSNLSTITNSLPQMTTSNPIQIKFVTFNGTNVLERLVNKLASSHKKITINSTQYNLDIDTNIEYVHSNIHQPDDIYLAKAFGTTDDIILNRISKKTNRSNELKKTNSSFITCIDDANLFVIHGLTLGITDGQYMKWIIDRVENGAIALDLPLRSTNTRNRKKQYTNFCTTTEAKSRVIVDVNPTYVSSVPGPGSLIFHF